MKFLKIGITIAFAFGLTGMVLVQPANAQNGKIHKKHLEKARWHNAPRQFQIIDDRPIIKDFREAPAQSEMISLPPGPQGYGGGHRGGGSGAMGDSPMGGSGPISAPSAPGTMPYRTGDGGRQLPLPKSGFGRHTNIPARGMAPKNALPNGTTTNRLMGKMMAPKKVIGRSGGSPRGMSPSTRPTSGGGPKVSTYSGGSGDGYGSGYGGNSSKTTTLVRGSLLKKGN